MVLQLPNSICDARKKDSFFYKQSIFNYVPVEKLKRISLGIQFGGRSVSALRCQLRRYPASAHDATSLKRPGARRDGHPVGGGFGCRKQRRSCGSASPNDGTMGVLQGSRPLAAAAIQLHQRLLRVEINPLNPFLHEICIHEIPHPFPENHGLTIV